MLVNNPYGHRGDGDAISYVGSFFRDDGENPLYIRGAPH